MHVSSSTVRQIASWKVQNEADSRGCTFMHLEVVRFSWSTCWVGPELARVEVSMRIGELFRGFKFLRQFLTKWNALRRTWKPEG